MKALVLYTHNLENKGITLIALVITIIILLILAGITITQITGRGLFGKAEIAKQRTRYVTAKEIIDLKLMEIQTDCISKGEEYNIVKIAEEMEKAENIEIEKYYNKETATIKDGVEKNLTNLEGIVVSVKEYSEYKFLIGEDCQVKGVFEGELTDTINKEDFIDIKEFEAKRFGKNIEFSYEIKKAEANKMQIVIIVKDTVNGLDKIEYANGEILECNGQKQVEIDYTINLGVEYKFKITSSNGYVEERKIFEDNLDIFEVLQSKGETVEDLNKYGITISKSGRDQIGGFNELYSLGMGSSTKINRNTFILTMDYETLVSQLGNEQFKGICVQFNHGASTDSSKYTSWVNSKIIVNYDDGIKYETPNNETIASGRTIHEEYFGKVIFEENKKISTIEIILDMYDANYGSATGCITYMGLLTK